MHKASFPTPVVVTLLLAFIHPNAWGFNDPGLPAVQLAKPGRESDPVPLAKPGALPKKEQEEQKKRQKEQETESRESKEVDDAAHGASVPAQCREKHDDHGTWNGSRVPGGRYVLTCDKGFEVDGNPSITLSCTHDVHWPADPWCENIDDCAKLVHACGPAGLCVDHNGWAECMCESGAIMHNTSHGEVVCYFKNESKHCGGRNCGAHGICIDLTEFQDSFDSGEGKDWGTDKESFRCSCERGFHDDGTSCAPVDCGPREDPLGKWTGETTYLGEYTLECDEGAFLWGGSKQAITITCPSHGVWRSWPVCKNPEEIRRDEELESFRFWINVGMALVCIVCAAIAAGLTMGLVSLDDRELEVIQEADSSDCDGPEEKERLRQNQEAARRIKPVLQDHHRLLVTLLLLNAMANEALPIFLDDLMPPILALLVSVTFVLLCGEIIPSAIFTGPMQMTFAANFIPLVECLQCMFQCIARPIATALDKYLGHEEDTLYTRPELKAVLCLHSQGGDPRSARSREVGGATSDDFGLAPEAGSRETPGYRSDQPMLNSPSTPASGGSASPTAGVKGNPSAPLTSLETELCLNTMRLAEMQIQKSDGFCPLRICSSACYAASPTTMVATAIAEAGVAGKELVVVVKSDPVFWPAETRIQDIVAVMRLSALLAQVHTSPIGLCCKKLIARMEIEDSVLDGLKRIDSVGDSLCPFGAVAQRGDFAGFLDGEAALLELLSQNHRVEYKSPRRLTHEVQDVVQDVAEALTPSERRGGVSPMMGATGTSASLLAPVSETDNTPNRTQSARRNLHVQINSGMHASIPIPAYLQDGYTGAGRSPTGRSPRVRIQVSEDEEDAGNNHVGGTDTEGTTPRRDTFSPSSTAASGRAGAESEAGQVMATQSELSEPCSPSYRNDGPLRNEIRQAYCEYEKDQEALRDPADASPFGLGSP